MKKPVLVIMAAGMGSRYGGLKQIDPVDEQGHIIMDFSIYDAKRAGFEKVVFIIKHENEEDFKKSIGNRMAAAVMEVEYVFQELDESSGRISGSGRKDETLRNGTCYSELYRCSGWSVCGDQCG